MAINNVNTNVPASAQRVTHDATLVPAKPEGAQQTQTAAPVDVTQAPTGLSTLASTDAMGPSASLGRLMEVPLTPVPVPTISADGLRSLQAEFAAMSAQIGPKPTDVSVANPETLTMTQFEGASVDAFSAIPASMTASILSDANANLEGAAGEVASHRFEALSSAMTQANHGVVGQRLQSTNANQATLAPLAQTLAPQLQALVGVFVAPRLGLTRGSVHQQLSAQANPAALVVAERATARAIESLSERQREGSSGNGGNQSGNSPIATHGTTQGVSTRLVASGRGAGEGVAADGEHPVVFDANGVAYEYNPALDPVTIPDQTVVAFESQFSSLRNSIMNDANVMDLAMMVMSEASKDAAQDLKQRLLDMKKINEQKANLRAFTGQLRDQKAAMNSTLHTEYERRCGLDDADPAKIFRGEVSFDTFAQNQKVALYRGSLGAGPDGMPIPGPVIFKISPNTVLFEHSTGNVAGADGADGAGGAGGTDDVARSGLTTTAASEVEAQRLASLFGISAVEARGMTALFDSLPQPKPGSVQAFLADSTVGPGLQEGAANQSANATKLNAFMAKVSDTTVRQIYPGYTTHQEALASIANVNSWPGDAESTPEASARKLAEAALGKMPEPGRTEVDTELKNYLIQAARVAWAQQDKPGEVDGLQLSRSRSRIDEAINRLPEAQRGDALRYVQLRTAQQLQGARINTHYASWDRHEVYNGADARSEYGRQTVEHYKHASRDAVGVSVGGDRHGMFGVHWGRLATLLESDVTSFGDKIRNLPAEPGYTAGQREIVGEIRKGAAGRYADPAASDQQLGERYHLNNDMLGQLKAAWEASTPKAATFDAFLSTAPNGPHLNASGTPAQSSTAAQTFLTELRTPRDSTNPPATPTGGAALLLQGATNVSAQARALVETYRVLPGEARALEAYWSALPAGSRGSFVEFCARPLPQGPGLTGLTGTPASDAIKSLFMRNRSGSAGTTLALDERQFLGRVPTWGVSNNRIATEANQMISRIPVALAGRVDGAAREYYRALIDYETTRAQNPSREPQMREQLATKKTALMNALNTATTPEEHKLVKEYVALRGVEVWSWAQNPIPGMTINASASASCWLTGGNAEQMSAIFGGQNTAEPMAAVVSALRGATVHATNEPFTNRTGATVNTMTNWQSGGVISDIVGHAFPEQNRELDAARAVAAAATTRGPNAYSEQPAGPPWPAIPAGLTNANDRLELGLLRALRQVNQGHGAFSEFRGFEPPAVANTTSREQAVAYYRWLEAGKSGPDPRVAAEAPATPNRMLSAGANEAPASNRAERFATRDGREVQEFTLEQLSTTLETWQSKQDTLGDLSQEASLSIQMYQDRYTKFMSTLSNMMKKASETESQIISNMK